MVPKFQLLIQDEILFSDSRSHVISRPSLDAAERTRVRASDDAQLICLEMVRRAGQLGYSFHERTQPFSAASFTSLGVEPCLWGPLAFRGHTFQRSLGRRTTLANELRSHFRSKARVADPSRADAGRFSDRKPCRSRGRNAKCTMIGATLFPGQRDQGVRRPRLRYGVNLAHQMQKRQMEIALAIYLIFISLRFVAAL